MFLAFKPPVLMQLFSSSLPNFEYFFLMLMALLTFKIALAKPTPH